MRKGRRMFSQNTEVRITSSMLGVTSVVAAGLLLSPEFATFGLQGLLAVIFAVSGVMQIYGAVMPVRCVRQLGLIFGAICWFALAGAVISLSLALTMAIAVLGLSTFAAYLEDVRRKPREKCSVS